MIAASDPFTSVEREVKGRVAAIQFHLSDTSRRPNLIRDVALVEKKLNGLNDKINIVLKNRSKFQHIADAELKRRVDIASTFGDILESEFHFQRVFILTIKQIYAEHFTRFRHRHNYIIQKEITSIGFEEATQSTYDSEANLPNVFIVGNKVDLEYWRQVRAELDNRTKSELGESTLAAKFIEISTFSGANVDKLAAGLLKRVFMDIVPFNQRGNLQAVARPLADSTIRTELLRTILKSCEMDKQSMKMNFSNKNSECVRYSATRIQRWTGEIDRPMSPSCPRGIELMELVSGGLEHARVGLRYLKDIYRTAFYDPPLLELRKSIKVLKDSIDLFSHSLHALQGVLSASSSYSSPPPVSPPPVSPPLVSPPSVSPPPVSPPPVSPPPSLGIVRRDDAIAGTEEMKSPSSDSFEMVLASIRDLNRFSTTTATNAATTSVAAATTSTTHPTTLGLGFTGGANVEGIDVHSLLNFVEGVVTQLASITEECSQFASLLPPSPSIRSMHQNVFFVAVARLSGGLAIIAASFAFNCEVDSFAVRRVMQDLNFRIYDDKMSSISVGESTFSFIGDSSGLIYLAITANDFPRRYVHACLKDVQTQFCSKVGGGAVASAREKQYDRACAGLFERICRKYDDLLSIDAAVSVAKKVENVMLDMDDDIQAALQNCVRIESIEARAEELQQQAGVFRKNAAELKNKMFWKSMTPTIPWRSPSAHALKSDGSVSDKVATPGGVVGVKPKGGLAKPMRKGRQAVASDEDLIVETKNALFGDANVTSNSHLFDEDISLVRLSAAVDRLEVAGLAIADELQIQGMMLDDLDGSTSTAKESAAVPKSKQNKQNKQRQLKKMQIVSPAAVMDSSVSRKQDRSHDEDAPQLLSILASDDFLPFPQSMRSFPPLPSPGAALPPESPLPMPMPMPMLSVAEASSSPQLLSPPPPPLPPSSALIAASSMAAGLPSAAPSFIHQQEHPIVPSTPAPNIRIHYEEELDHRIQIRDEEEEESSQIDDSEASTDPVPQSDDVGAIMIMTDNIAVMLERGESMDALNDSSGKLLEQSKQFLVNKKKQSHNCLEFALCCCLPCIGLITCLRGTISCCSSVISQLVQGCVSKKLFDNVLADTENAFQTLAKFLVLLMVGPDSCCAAYRVVMRAASYTVSTAVVVGSSLALILPSFFTLLIVRTTTTEKESTAFGERQEVIRHEKPEQSLVRWVRIVVRSLPMVCFLFVLPFVLVFCVFPGAVPETITGSLWGYLVAVLLLQCLGTVRAYYSWKDQEREPPTAPQMHAEPKNSLLEAEIKTGQSNSRFCCSATCCNRVSQGSSASIRKPTPIPAAPNSFNLTKPANWLIVASLALEFFQMASFPLQNNPYASSSVNSPTPSPTLSPSGSAVIVDGAVISTFWGQQIFGVVYVTLSANLQIVSMWAAVTLVLLLVLVFSAQFLHELREYGRLLHRVEDKDAAKDWFFFSFTGAIVYGHGRPRNLSSMLKSAVATLTDGLFLVINLRLLNALACDYSASPATLLVDSSVVCWQGSHAKLASISLACYALYVPLSIMIAPMLSDTAPSPSSSGAGKGTGASSDEGVVSDTGGQVSYVKLYLMAINIVKSAMLLVGTLGPRNVVTVVASTSVSSFVLGALTLVWFRQASKNLEGEERVFDEEIQPCNKAFINSWKCASYSAAVASAVIIVAAHQMGPLAFPSRNLLPALVASWVLIVVLFAVAQCRWESRNRARVQRSKALIELPYRWREHRERVEELGLDPDLAFAVPAVAESMKGRGVCARGEKLAKESAKEEEEHAQVEEEMAAIVSHIAKYWSMQIDPVVILQ